MTDLMSYQRKQNHMSLVEAQLELWKADNRKKEIVASYGIGGFAGLRKHPKVRQAQSKALQSTKAYPQTQGEPWLLQAIADSYRFDTDDRVKLNPETEVSASDGARGALMVLMETLVQIFGRGAAVVIPDSGYGGTYWSVVRAGLVPVLVQCGLGKNYAEGVLHKIDELQRSGQPLAAVIWEPVHNPTGTLGTVEECLAVGRATHEAGAVFVGDEVYIKFVYHGRPCPSVLELFDHRRVPLVAIRTGSKIHANSQDRIGDIAGTASLIGRFIDTKGVINYGPPIVCQEGYRSALIECRNSAAAIVKLISYRADVLYDGLPKIGWNIGQKPDAGMFGLVPKPERFTTASGFCLKAARKLGLRFWSLEAFCRPDSNPELVEKAQKLIRLPFVETLDGMRRTFEVLPQLIDNQNKNGVLAIA